MSLWETLIFKPPQSYLYIQVYIYLVGNINQLHILTMNGKLKTLQLCTVDKSKSIQTGISYLDIFKAPDIISLYW